ncbi:coiled-coil domain-containing protein [Actinokineospora pegani]|uniref:hypothetical protein n=1 Tax=Actinokineospora pegani TaxID=2654637 RepID=UPI0012E9C286|nr:hypothetical protein [Actinokineospora pegani]
MPPSPYGNWDGQAGLPDITGDLRLRALVADIAELDEDFEVRDAAAQALRGDDTAVMAFLTQGHDAARAMADHRRAETARRDLDAVRALAGSGGPIFNAEVQRVLAGSDADRAAFLAYGAEIARARDEQADTAQRDRAAQLRARVTALAASPAPEVAAAARVALQSGDPAIAEFLRSGYQAAAQRDAAAREQQVRDQETRDKAAEDLSDLAQRAARAWTARSGLVTAHGHGVRALQQAANALVQANQQARKAEQILLANTAGGTHPPGSFTEVKAESARQLGFAGQAAAAAWQAATQAAVEAQALVDTGLTYGVDWARIATGMSHAADAAVLAVQTAGHAIDAAESTDQARNAQELAAAKAEQARQWRLHAEEHARAAAVIAGAAQVQAEVARDAATRARQARADAERQEQAAWTAAARTREHRLTAEAEQRKAAGARAVAERERAASATAAAEADRQAATARAQRGEADRQAGIATQARQRAEQQQGLAGQAEQHARAEAAAAATARDRAYAAEQGKQTAEAKAQALAAAEAAARGTSAHQAAQQAANQAAVEAATAGDAATRARQAADNATGAAVLAQQTAAEANRAAARATAAAREADAAAAAANAAASQAESTAAAAHQAATSANASAADATLGETRAAEAAGAAVALAEQAAGEALRSLWSAQRTLAEAEAAAAEAVSAATQAEQALRSATAASASSAAITDPANSTIRLVAPFAGQDIDADFAALVAAQAQAVGSEQAQAARTRAGEAATAARLAAEAAQRAAAEVKPAFDAAAAASASASVAAASAAEAQQAAAEAAAEGAAARAAGARASQADAQARADAVVARHAANSANADAAIAGRNAAAAEQDAVAARASASAAVGEATAARAAATRAESEAAAARHAADAAQGSADAAAEAAANARASAIDAQKAADRAEEQARQDAARARQEQAAPGPTTGLTPDELELLYYEGAGDDDVDGYHAAVADANKTVPQFLAEAGAGVLLEVIGVNDAIRCFGEGNVEACLWTLVNVASFVVIIAKLPAVASAIGKVVAGLTKFLEASAAGRRLLEGFHAVVARAKANPCLVGIVAGGLEGARAAQPVGLASVGDECIKWIKTSSPTFGHTFKTHGSGAKNLRKLVDRARTTNNDQGQWLDDDAAVELLKQAYGPGFSPKIVPLPPGLGHVIKPDGSIVPALRAILIPSGNGLYKTAYPTLKETT